MWSTLLFSRESPPYRDVHLWQQALQLLVPQGHASHRLGQFKAKGHKIWEWRLDTDQEQLYRIRGPTMYMYMPSDTEGRTRRGNRWYCALRGIPREDKGIVCLVSEHGGGDVSVDCWAKESWSSISTLDFWGVLHKWQRTWMWDNLQWIGDDDWLPLAILEGTCIAVTDGSYMQDLYAALNLAAVVIECTKGRGQLWCSFLEASRVACSYRGELLGLMAIHLILLAINEVNPALTGLVHIYSDCLGALCKVQNLPQKGCLHD